MSTTNSLANKALAAQAAYGFFDRFSPFDALRARDEGDMAPAAARSFLGLAENLTQIPSVGFRALAHFPDDATGFSATVFENKAGGLRTLSIRGTAGPIDRLQDAKFGIVGFASDQAISLYRYYRRLTTPGGQPVQYSADERELLHRLNVTVPGGLGLLAPLFTDMSLDAALAGDVGVTPLQSNGSVLQPGEPLIVTGHSLGGHLALLFGRLFPLVAESIYTFNAPGILPWGDFILTNAGVAANDPSRIANVVANYGLDFAAAVGTKPGPTYRVFNEFSSDNFQNHSIVPLSDSLALYELIGSLSPGLADRIDEVSSILAAASAKPEESLERTLDMLRRVVAGDTSGTQIARTNLDQAQRDEYYTRLYELRDGHAGARDWGIASLAGWGEQRLLEQAQTSHAHRYALAELMPFVTTGATFDDASLAALSDRWLAARADFAGRLLEARTNDFVVGQSGTNRNFLFLDVDRNERFAVLDATNAALARTSGSELDSFLAGLSYNEKTVFGSDDAGTGDSIDGSAGTDRLFGNAGDDALRGMGSGDILEGGAGEDTLEGGDGDDILVGGDGADDLAGGGGYDVYELDTLDLGDRISDSDGAGAVEVDGIALAGGYLDESGLYESPDGLHRYEFSGDLATGGLLRVDDVLEIEGFRNGDLGILLTPIPEPEFTPGIADFAYVGDLQPLDTNPSTGFIDQALDEYWNVLPSTTPFAGYPDRFYGRPGNTSIISLDAHDFVEERWGGDDTLSLGSGRDFAFAGEGNDYIEGGANRDYILAGRGDDLVHADSPSEDIDIPLPAEGVRGYDCVSGGEGNDTLYGSGRPELIEGGAHADLIVAGAGDDYVFGDGILISTTAGEAYDVEVVANLVGTFVFDLAERVSPDDITDGNFAPGVVVFNPDGSTPTMNGALWNVLDAGDDRIFAGEGNDFVLAGGGADSVYGMAGDDRLEGGSGDDEIHGGEGADTIYGEGAPGAVMAPADPEAEPGHDRLFGGAGRDVLYGQGGADLLDGGLEVDRLDGGAGNDTVLGGEGDDSVYGGAGDDALLGGDGFDILQGGEGVDVLDGGGGNDAYLGGDGDVYVIRPGSGVDLLEFAGAPGSGTIRIDGVVALEEVSVGVDPFGGTVAIVLAGAEDFLAISADLASLSAFRVELADGGVYTLDELPALSPSGPALPTSTLGTSGPDAFFPALGAQQYAGGAGDDMYFLGPGAGRDAIDDESGTDAVFLFGMASNEVSVRLSGGDHLLRYPGGEARLIRQTESGYGIDLVIFEGDGATWTRDDLAARAQPLEDGSAPLGVAVAMAGEPFEFEVPGDAFAGQYTLGAPALELAATSGEPLPAWLSFDAASGVISGTPAAGDAGIESLLVGLRDEGAIVAVAPLVIAVEAASQPPAEPDPPPAEPPPPVVSPPPVEPPPVASSPPVESAPPVEPTDPASVAVIDTPPLLTPQPSTNEISIDVAFAEIPSPSDAPRPEPRPVGEIDDALFERFEALLSAPAATHAPRFLERYAEAMREFEERRRSLEEPAPEEAPPPSDEEVALHNAALQAWLDEDARRMAGAEAGEAWDFGGFGASFVASGGGLETLLGTTSEAFARPGLPLRAIQQQPGLREGLASLSG